MQEINRDLEGFCERARVRQDRFGKPRAVEGHQQFGIHRVTPFPTRSARESDAVIRSGYSSGLYATAWFQSISSAARCALIRSSWKFSAVGSIDSLGASVHFSDSAEMLASQ